MAQPVNTACHCESGRDYSECCGPLHVGATAPSAEAVMRARYCAYVLGLEAYLLASWHPDTRPEDLKLSGDSQPRWLGLKIKRHEPAGDHAIVEFVARYRVGGARAQGLHEISRFSRQADEHWYYVDGEIV